MTSIVTFDELEADPHEKVFPNAEPKTVKLDLPAGEGVPKHSHPERDIVFTVLEGAIELQLDEETHELEVGDVARFEGEREIAPRAVEASTALIVLAPRADG